MPRSNTPGSNDRWSRLSASAQFRASINGDCSWGNDRPSPDLITCSRISPGGRMLVAFEIAAVRDYFVDGHLDQGAQPEPDGANRASARRSTQDPWSPDPQVVGNSFDLAVAAYSLAAEQHRAAEAQLDAYVLPRIAELKADGEIKAAVALRNALPMSCFT